ncbi:hypothetical protein CEN50_22860 [Fischerella thermalis CCMEE 5268]|uniref:Uncharacterized protein n=1 Tax=Fischerella thermalis CCMEE 5268 TaxID=2019662 RepID=A0A2N6KAG4_9CYAN|nr:hypothetical protein [Fischerella thermalis]PLZ95285.1 hypothetical protein CEN50_22860 [Fischerella thermalis CCMEE 5268]
MVNEQDKEDVYNYIKSIISELDKKADRPNVVIEEVLAWTYFQKYLTKVIFEFLLEPSEPFITNGEENERITNLIHTRLIKDWEFQEASVHLRNVQNIIFNSTQTRTLLKLYQKILHEDYVPINNSPEQQELLASGLVTIEAGKFRVANRIYKQVFNQNWIDKNLNKNQQKSPKVNSVDELVPQNNPPQDSERRASEVARVFAYLFIVILGVSFISLLLFLILKSSQSSSSNSARSISACQKFSYELDEALKKPQDRLNVIKKGLLWRQEKGISLNEQCEDFRKNLEKSGITPSDMENKLNQVLRQEAQIKIDTNQLEEAVDILCKISDEYESMDDLKSIFQRWELTRGTKIQNKINQVKSSCPAAQY